jgi:hypothetical protein
MNTQIVISTLVLLGLVAAGFALTVPTSTEAGHAPTNVTIILKNRDFPLKARMTMEPCALHICADI